MSAPEARQDERQRLAAPLGDEGMASRDHAHTAAAGLDWNRSGNLLYTLVQDGWRKGEPVMVNQFTVRVDGDLRYTTADATECLVEDLLAHLSSATQVVGDGSRDDLKPSLGDEGLRERVQKTLGDTFECSACGKLCCVAGERIDCCDRPSWDRAGTARLADAVLALISSDRQALVNTYRAVAKGYLDRAQAAEAQVSTLQAELDALRGEVAGVLGETERHIVALYTSIAGGNAEAGKRFASGERIIEKTRTLLARLNPPAQPEATDGSRTLGRER